MAIGIFIHNVPEGIAISGKWNRVFMNMHSRMFDSFIGHSTYIDTFLIHLKSQILTSCDLFLTHKLSPVHCRQARPAVAGLLASKFFGIGRTSRCSGRTDHAGQDQARSGERIGLCSGSYDYRCIMGALSRGLQGQ